jgi:hypothetical protein
VPFDHLARYAIHDFRSGIYSTGSSPVTSCRDKPGRVSALAATSQRGELEPRVHDTTMGHITITLVGSQMAHGRHLIGPSDREYHRGKG